MAGCASLQACTPPRQQTAFLSQVVTVQLMLTGTTIVHLDAEVNVRYSVRTSQRTLQVTAMTNGLYTKCCIWQQCLFVVKCLTRRSDMTCGVAETFSVRLGGTESQTWPSVGSTPS